jgi:N-acetylglucosamine-6-phosphate deacetylase
MIVLAGADVVLPDRVMPQTRVIIDGGRIAALAPRRGDDPDGATRVDVSGCLVVPGFVDVHVHGVEGHDVLEGPQAVREVAARLPRFGVTGFCPTSVACSPQVLATFLSAVDEARTAPAGDAARVLGAHLESNFISPDYRGAQPAACLRSIKRRLSETGFGGPEILDVISRFRDAVRIVTMAPERESGLELARQLTAAGHIVSIGHSGATYEEALAAIDAGVSHATHLFNRMTPLTHRAPGVPGAVLESDEVTAELICDGFHVHPSILRLALRAKGPDRILAISDGTAGSGLAVGSRARLGDEMLIVTERTAVLEDGTLAGSVVTMDGVFRTLVRQAGLSVVEAALLCATSPVRQLGVAETGRIEAGLTADLAVLDADLRVRQTYLAGVLWRNTARAGNV